MQATTMDNTAQQKAPARRVTGFAYFMTPSGWAFLVLATAAISILAFRERSVGLIFDQEAYINYFRSTDWHWLVQFYRNRESDMGFLISLITEELGWRSWVILLNAFGVSPEGGIRTTVVLLNLIVMYALLQTRRPLIGLVLWLVIPYALATVGLFQIRQGFGLAIAMLFACRFNRPTLGMGLASFVHTTFAVPTAFLLTAGLFGEKKARALVAVSVVAVVLASAARFLFATYGGRRIDEYTGYQENFTIKLLALLLFYTMASVMVLYSTWRSPDTARQNSLTRVSMMHVGLFVYLVVAFFVFPFAKGRVWYCVPLLLPFLAPEIKLKNAAVLVITFGVFVAVAADATKSYFEGVYHYFLML
ncbi:MULTISPECIES: EpsG family protein [Burkholderiaceae]|uniref:EpsG family protein n=1 Tax=Burkholderiaceae TaxID=119060 RepID=UPI001CEC2868|nr:MULTISPECIES: EpsG family protein [Burkholderiaceae]